MNKFKGENFYKDFILSNEKLNSINKLEDDENFTENYFTKSTYDDKPSTEEMLTRIQGMLHNSEKNREKYKHKKSMKLLLVAAIIITITIFGIFSTGVSGNVFKFFENVLNIKDSKYVLIDHSETVEENEYIPIKKVLPKLKFTPTVPKYLPEGFKLSSIEPIVSETTITMSFENGDKVLLLNEKYDEIVSKTTGTIADTENSDEIVEKILGNNVTIYQVKRGNAINSTSLRWSVNDIQYSIMSHGIEYKDLIKVIKSLCYLK